MSSSSLSIRTDPGKPRLSVQMSWWAMSGLGEPEHPDTLERRFERIAGAGFDGINGFLPPPEEAEQWDRLLDRYELCLSVNSYPRTAAELAADLDRARSYGRIEHVNVQVMRPFVTDEAAVALLRELCESSWRAGVPAYIETHRGTITQDLIRTAAYVEAVESLRLTIDLSHYVVAGELLRESEEAEQRIDRLLDRTAAIHGRISNGQQIQDDLSPDGEHPMLPHFLRWWETGMRRWLASALGARSPQGTGEGAASMTAIGMRDAVLPFICELGPPPYAMTVREADGAIRELGDRW
ncbi:sugar phosphate isomerase/epimerase family protein, partial [Paenibacillus sp. 598K]|uniref:sugar phosphate isomerase/epimerase family protein n=1 Tax=Paenibacillus sp. 598K TaxID=1117987 RepID=UPI0021AAB116